MREELREVFLSESRSILRSLREGLAAAQDRPERLAELFRRAHMLQGDVNLAGMPELERVAGPLADRLKEAEDRGSLDREQAALLAEAVEACEGLLEGRRPAGAGDLAERLARVPAASSSGVVRDGLRLLLIEESELQSETIRRELAGAGEVRVETAGRLAEGIERASRGGVDAVLLDLNLPDSQGVDSFVRLSGSAPSLPVVILTISDDDAMATEALRRGAQDYLVKSRIDYPLLSRVIRYAIERQRILGSLQEARRTLESRVRERTLELTKANEALRRQSAALERSNRELGLFASIAAHELQAPLRKIVTWGDLLKGNQAGELSPSSLRYLETMRKAALSLAETVDRLRELTRVAAAETPLEAVELDAVLRDVLEEMRPRLEAAGGRVEAEPLPAVKGDAVQLGQLLRNLIDNAIKYRRKDAPLVVTVRAEAPAGGPVRVTVEDNGLGFDPKDAGKLFQPFQRLRRDPECEGMGMGLAICARIAWRHGGSIAARGAPSKGAVFTVTLAGPEAKP